MGSLGLHWARNLLFLCLLGVPTYCQQAQSSNSPPDSLFSPSAVQILQRDYTKNRTSYLLLDAKTGGDLASNWDNSEKTIPMRCLVKPVTALAYAQPHDFR